MWVSSGFDDAGEVMQKAGVLKDRIRIDNRATDTVTNFTSLLDTFVEHDISRVRCCIVRVTTMDELTSPMPAFEELR